MFRAVLELRRLTCAHLCRARTDVSHAIWCVEKICLISIRLTMFSMPRLNPNKALRCSATASCTAAGAIAQSGRG